MNMKPELKAVQYIGFKPEWRDHLYGSGLYFSTDQVRTVPFQLARRLLRHADLFTLARLESGEVGSASDGGDTQANTADTANAANTGDTADTSGDTAGDLTEGSTGDQEGTGQQDDTAELLEQAEQARAEQEKEEFDLADLHREIDSMDFTTLATFAETRYGLTLTKQKGLERGRAEVHARIDQFGAV